MPEIRIVQHGTEHGQNLLLFYRLMVRQKTFDNLFWHKVGAAFTGYLLRDCVLLWTGGFSVLLQRQLRR